MRKLLGLLLFLSVGFSQINDKNFKSEINGGVTVCVFTSELSLLPIKFFFFRIFKIIAIFGNIVFKMIK